VKRRTSVSTPAQSPHIEHDRSCTSAQCQVQADHRGSGPLTSNKWTRALNSVAQKKECELQINAPVIEKKTKVPLEMVSAGDHWSLKMSRQIDPLALMLG
jgi:hypothetical protein